jgi:hypothetical protein
MSAGEAGAEESEGGKTEILYDDEGGKTEILYDDESEDEDTEHDQSGAEESVSDEELETEKSQQQRRNCRVDEKKTNNYVPARSAAGRQEGYV